MPFPFMILIFQFFKNALKQYINASKKCILSDIKVHIFPLRGMDSLPEISIIIINSIINERMLTDTFISIKDWNTLNNFKEVFS